MSIVSSDFTRVRASPHQAEVRAFLQTHFAVPQWEFTLPHGWGKETYFASGAGQIYFVKLGAPIAIYQVMASMKLTPSVIAAGSLDDGTSILVQPYIKSRTPRSADFQHYLDQFATTIGIMQHSDEVREALPNARSDRYSDLALDALNQIRRKWDKHKSLVPDVALEVEEKLYQLGREINSLDGTGVVASHNDVCNANWLIAADETIYLIDLDSMSMDDPARDLGAILWWYYPPELRPHFLHTAGYINSEPLQARMRLRMALHCLDICLPREHSFDQFNAENFDSRLEDFRAILAGKENPQGYDHE